jgi:hypothetical protein
MSETSGDSATICPECGAMYNTTAEWHYVTCSRSLSGGAPTIYSDDEWTWPPAANRDLLIEIRDLLQKMQADVAEIKRIMKIKIL